MTKKILLALGLVCAAPAAAQNYDGVFRPDGDVFEAWDCKSVGEDGGALVIMGQQFIGVENQCTLNDPVTVRDMDATLYDAECSSEGETTTSRVMLMKTDAGVTIIWPGYTVALRSCQPDGS